MSVKKLTLKSTLIPSALSEIPIAPKELYYRGTLNGLTDAPRVAIVGSRKATSYGRAVTAKLARELAEHGVVIISGLALGIDSIAHQAALEVNGNTVAVMPCGLDRVYPASHASLARKILAQGGALISEYPEGTAPLPHQFIARNRIISGLSDAVLITEAAINSGSLHTANFALEQGRTVFAVPGNITSANSAGTNNLIKSGAIPVTTVEDVVTNLGLDAKTRQAALPTNAEEAILLQLLTEGVSDATLLLAQSELDPAVFNQTLTMLEITGKIRPLGAGHWGL